MNKILKYYLRAIFLLFPIIFIPVITDSFGFGKNLSLMVMAIVALILWTIGLILAKEKMVKTNKLFWLFLIFTAWSVVSFLRLETGIKMTSLMSPMGMGTVLSLFILFFVWLQFVDKKEIEKQFLFLTISGLIVGILSLIVFVLPANKLPLLIPKIDPLISITSAWSLTGSLLAEMTLLVFLIFGWLRKLLAKIKEKEEMMVYLTDAMAVAFFSLLFFLDIYKVFKLGWGVLDRNSAWVIAVEVFKRNPIFGQGIGNFTEAFNLFRPASFNLTKYWTNIFAGSSMGILHIWTELGIVGLILVFYLILTVLRLKKNINFWQVLLFLAVVLFLPLNLMSVFLLVWLLVSIGLEVKETKLILSVGENNFNAMPYLVALLVLILSVGSGYWMTRMFLGDVYMRQSLLAASKNDGEKTYNLQIKAIGFNPNVASYRKIYSQTNLSLTQALLSEKEITDEQKEKASVLVQQAVREAKAAIALDNNNSAYWYNLAGIYKSLIGLVDGAADWSYEAYQQAIILDPVNPVLHLEMGGLFYAANNFEQADRSFEDVVTNKNDFANGWYNFANSSKKLNKLDLAVTYLETALKLVPADSSDYETASKELEVWKKELAELNAKNKVASDEAAMVEPETLKTPEPLPTMGTEEKVDVSADQLEPPMVEPTQEIPTE